MSPLTGIPWIIKILGTLTLILVLNRLLKNLIVSVFIGILTLAILSGHPLTAALNIAWTRFSSVDNIFLLIVIFQVICLSEQMSKTGTMKDLVQTVQGRLTKRGAIAALPALIGFLPMPGGALFSAPLVDDCDPSGNISPQLKTKINYWFRHVWEYWWPLYSGVLLAMDITGLKVWEFMLFGVPLSCFACLAGYLFFLKKIKNNPPVPSPGRERPNPGRQSFFRLVLPIIVVIIVYLFFQIVFPGIAGLNRYLPLFLGLIGAMLILQIQRPLPWHLWKNFLRQKKTFTLLGLVAMIQIYGAFIEARLPDGTLLAGRIHSELDAFGIPPVVLIMIIPFISALASGLAIGFVGASFPVILSLLGENPEFNTVLSTTALAYSFGFSGMILSPVHICLIVTNEYFHTRMFPTLRRLLAPLSLTLIGGILVYLFLRTL